MTLCSSKVRAAKYRDLRISHLNRRSVPGESLAAGLDVFV